MSGCPSDPPVCFQDSKSYTKLATAAHPITSADDVFIMDFVSETARLMTLRSKAAGEEVTLEKALLHPLVSGTDVHGYAALPCRQFILFPYDVMDETASLLPWPDIVARFPRIAERTSSIRASDRLRLVSAVLKFVRASTAGEVLA